MGISQNQRQDTCKDYKRFSNKKRKPSSFRINYVNPKIILI